MLIKISLALNGILLVLVAITFVQSHGMVASVDTLSRRVTDLEVQNVQLARQMAWVEQNLGDSRRQPAGAGTQRGEKQAQMTPSRKQITATSENSDVSTADMAVTELKADLRREVEAMVAQEQTDSRTKRRQEWQQRMSEGVKQSLADFAEDHQLDDSVTQQISALFDESMEKRQQLREELDARNMSFYEFRQEERKMRDEMNSKLSTLLTEDQLAAFEQTFPVGPGRMGGRSGGPRP